MTSAGPMYKNALPVSDERHKGWSVTKHHDYGFARDMNAVPLSTAEFAAAAREYLIVFFEEGDVVAPAAILGLRDHENLYVNSDGSWKGNYVPLFLQRYPFVLAHNAAAKTYTLCIDEDSDHCNQTGIGDSLFNIDGKTSQYLLNMLNLTKHWRKSIQDSHAFCDRLRALNLLTENKINFMIGDKQASTSGILMVDNDRLNELRPEQLAELQKSGDLEFIYAHNFSRGVLDALQKKMAGVSQYDA